MENRKNYVTKKELIELQHLLKEGTKEANDKAIVILKRCYNENGYSKVDIDYLTILKLISNFFNLIEVPDGMPSDVYKGIIEYLDKFF